MAKIATMLNRYIELISNMLIERKMGKKYAPININLKDNINLDTEDIVN